MCPSLSQDAAFADSNFSDNQYAMVVTNLPEKWHKVSSPKLVYSCALPEFYN